MTSKRQWLAAASLCVAGMGCVGEPVDDELLDPTRASECGDGILVATVQADNGHDYTFCSDGEGGTGAMVTAPIGEPTLLAGIELEPACALDVFLAVAPEGAVAPQALIAGCSAAPEHAAQRATALRAALDATPVRPGARTNYCGSGGQSSFANNECPEAGPGLSTNFEWCRSALRTGWTQYTASTQMGAWPSHGRANVAACHGSAHLDYWKRESGGSSWFSLFNKDIAPNDDVSTSWWAGTSGSYGFDHDDYRARASSVGSGQYRFGGAYVDCESVFALCWQ